MGNLVCLQIAEKKTEAIGVVRQKEGETERSCSSSGFWSMLGLSVFLGAELGSWPLWSSSGFQGEEGPSVLSHPDM